MLLENKSSKIYVVYTKKFNENYFQLFILLFNSKNRWLLYAYTYNTVSQFTGMSWFHTIYHHISICKTNIEPNNFKYFSIHGTSINNNKAYRAKHRYADNIDSSIIIIYNVCVLSDDDSDAMLIPFKRHENRCDDKTRCCIIKMSFRRRAVLFLSSLFCLGPRASKLYLRAAVFTYNMFIITILNFSPRYQRKSQMHNYTHLHFKYMIC